MSGACLKYLLSLEAMFDPNAEQRGGRNQRVSERASAFAATSSEQKRDMKRLVLRAYTHRAALQHGETRPEKLHAANEWFTENELSLRMILSWATQRVLRLRAETQSFDPASYLYSAPVTDRRAAAQELMEVPLFWATQVQELMTLNPMMFTASGASVELLERPDSI